MPSDFFNSLVSAEATMANLEEVPYTYSIVLASNREEKTGTAITFAFKKPIDMSATTADSIASSVLGVLDTENLEYVDSILNQLRLTKKPLSGRKTGNGTIKIGASAVADAGDFRAGIQLVNGRFTSATDLRALLKLLTIKYVMEEMRSPSTRGLRYRTGRFASSVDLFPIAMRKDSPTRLSLFYTYMLYPYATFDPLVSTQPWLLKGGDRNPQKLIGEALLKAAKEVVHARYSFDIRQGT